MDIVKWGDIAFFCRADAIRGVRDISLSAQCETEDSTVDGQKFVKKKNSGGYAIQMTAVLNAFLGEDVQQTALALAEAARTGGTGYFYCGDNKLVPAQFMMTSAKVSDLKLAPDGTWISANVTLDLKQCSKADGASNLTGNNGGGGGGGGGKREVSRTVEHTRRANIIDGHRVTWQVTITTITYSDHSTLVIEEWVGDNGETMTNRYGTGPLGEDRENVLAPNAVQNRQGLQQNVNNQTQQTQNQNGGGGILNNTGSGNGSGTGGTRRNFIEQLVEDGLAWWRSVTGNGGSGSGNSGSGGSGTGNQGTGNSGAGS